MNENIRLAEKCRKTMNDFNFKGLYEVKNEECGIYHDEQGNLKLLNNYGSNKIVSLYEDALKELDDKKYTLGIISNGNHGIDLMDIYNNHHNYAINYDNFDEMPIMIVFDSPSTNLEDTFWYCNNCDTDDKKTRLLLKHEGLCTTDYLCKHLWRSKEMIDDCSNEDEAFKVKTYGQLIIALMCRARQKNIYTTNLFRYQVSDISEETYISFKSIKQSILKNTESFNNIVEEIFLKEVELFKPKYIVCVGADVRDYIKSKNVQQKISKVLNGQVVEYQFLYHPAAWRIGDKKMIENRKEVADFLKLL